MVRFHFLKIILASLHKVWTYVKIKVVFTFATSIDEQLDLRVMPSMFEYRFELKITDVHWKWIDFFNKHLFRFPVLQFQCFEIAYAIYSRTLSEIYNIQFFVNLTLLICSVESLILCHEYLLVEQKLYLL